MEIHSIGQQNSQPKFLLRCVLAYLLSSVLCGTAWSHEDGPAPDSFCDNAGPFGVPGLQSPADQIGEWSAVEQWPIRAIHSTVVSSGKILVWHDGLPPYLWNPTDHTLIETGSPDHEGDLFCAGHTTLADGRVLAVGGTVDRTSHLGSTEAHIFDPDTETWTRVADLQIGRWYPTVTALPDGRVLAMSGDITPDTRADIPEIYDPKLNTWTPLPGAELHVENYPYNFVMPDGRIFYAAGKNLESKADSSALDIETQKWDMVDTINHHGGSIEGSAAMYAPGKIVKIGGDVSSTGVLEGVEVIDLNDLMPLWRETAPMNYPRRRADIVLLPDGKSVVIGGAVAGQNAHECAVHAAEVWDPATESWTLVASHERPRIYHSTAILLPDGRVLTAGGDNHDGPEHNAEVYSPAYLFKGLRPTIVSAPGSVAYGESFGIQTPDAETTASVSLIRPGSVTHNFDQNQRFLSLAFTVNTDSLLVTAPANSNLAPPGDYMLFVVNGDGVPSHAAFVRLTADGGSGNKAPEVEITSPGNNDTFTEGDTVDFSGTATDMEEGNLTSSLSWNSKLDGMIGSGGSVTTNSLSVGSHLITASVTDLGATGATGSASIMIHVTSIGGGTMIKPSNGGGSVDWILLCILIFWAAVTRNRSGRQLRPRDF